MISALLIGMQMLEMREGKCYMPISLKLCKEDELPCCSGCYPWYLECPPIDSNNMWQRFCELMVELNAMLKAA